MRVVAGIFAAGSVVAAELVVPGDGAVGGIAAALLVDVKGGG